MECMHRFCGPCIQRCLRGGKQECPSCRQHVPSRRSLRRDTNFDAAIRKIFPDLEAHERRADRRIKKTNMANARVVAQKLKQGIKHQDEHRRKFRYVRTSVAATKRQKLQENTGEKKAGEQGYDTKDGARKVSSSSSSSSSSSATTLSSPVPSSSSSSSAYSSHRSSSSLPGRATSKLKKRRRKGKKHRRSLKNSNQDNFDSSNSSRHERAQQQSTLQRRSKLPPQTHSNERKAVAASIASGEEVRFQLKFDKTKSGGVLSDLEYPWLQTSSKIQVKHLKKYLARKLRVDKALSILVKVQGIPIVLQDELRYHEINDANAMRVLYYRLAV